MLKLLSQAWLAYVKNFPNGRNFDAVLKAIQEAQKAVFEEKETPA